MIKSILQYLIRRRNPEFRFDVALNSSALTQFVWIQFRGLMRGLKLLFRLRLPRMLMLGKRVSFFNLSRIRFGKFLKLGDDVHLSGLGLQGIVMGDNVGIGAFSRVVVSTSLNDIGTYIRIGNNVGIGEFAYLGGAGGLEIGDDCIIGQYFSCHPENHNFGKSDELIRKQGVHRSGIRIGHNCWIGSKVTILDGVTIGDGCVIAAGAVVTQPFEGNSVIAGVPAKLIKKRVLVP
jgi:acetyltransferase-like isoleucine patch superfamily enzyme